VKLSPNQLQAGNSLIVDADVKNTSRVDGEEVAEIYLNFPKLPGAPIRALRGFTRVHIGAGKTEHVRVALDPRDLSHVNEAGARIIAPGSYRLSIGGGQPDTGAPGAEVAFTITGQAELPE
jgi:beta-glucosidase